MKKICTLAVIAMFAVVGCASSKPAEKPAETPAAETPAAETPAPAPAAEPAPATP